MVCVECGYCGAREEDPIITLSILVCLFVLKEISLFLGEWVSFWNED